MHTTRLNSEQSTPSSTKHPYTSVSISYKSTGKRPPPVFEETTIVETTGAVDELGQEGNTLPSIGWLLLCKTIYMILEHLDAFKTIDKRNPMFSLI